MYPLVETIRITNGKAENLCLHEERMKRSLLELAGIDFSARLDQIVLCPPAYKTGVVKCRITYDVSSLEINFEPYFPRIIRSLQLVYDDAIEYPYKFQSRVHINELLASTTKDDILIVKNGLLTDISIANIIFFDGSRWYTPATPLLAGTKRRKLLDSGFLLEANISPGDLDKFTEVRIINAMLDPEDNPSVEITNISD